MKENILIVAPHCDDEVLGCGGTIAKLAEQGHTIYVIMVTNGNIGDPKLFPKEATMKNRDEARKACAYLGVKEVIFFDFPAPKLDSIPSYTLSMAISKEIHERNIHTMYIPHSGDIHRDHLVTHECCLVAARPINNCPIKKIYVYETLSETEWAMPLQNQAFIPTIFEDITNYIDKKIKAFKYYESQFKEFPHPRSIESIKALATHRGVTVNKPYAEAFMLVREIR